MSGAGPHDRPRARALAAPDRLAAIQALRGPNAVPDAGNEGDARATLARLARLATALTGAPLAVISRVDVERDCWLATAGFPGAVAAAGGTTVRPSFCEEVVVARGPVVARDALADPRFRAFPTVIEHGVRACLAVPLVAGGQAVGSFCVLDLAPRDWTDADLAAVGDLAAAAVAVLERGAAKAALHDLLEGGLDSAFLLQSVRDDAGRVADFVVVDCNTRAAEQLGMPRAALTGRRWHETFATPRARYMFTTYAHVAETGEPCELEFEVTDPRVAAKWLRVQAVRVGDGVAVTAQDVTERKAAEAALRESEGRFARVAGNVPGVVYSSTRGPDGRGAFAYVSESARAILGVDPEAIRRDASRLLGLVHPDDRASFARSLAESAAALAPWQWEGRVVLPCGEVKWLQGASRPERREDGGVVWDGLLLDVTDRHRAEAEREAAVAAVVEREARFRALIEHAQDMIGVLGADGTILYESPAMQRVLGVAPDGAPARPAIEYVHPDDRAEMFARFYGLLATSGARTRVHYRCRHADGSWRVLDGEAWNLVDHPAVGGVVVNVRDVTDRERAAAALRESESRLRLALDAANDGLWDWHVPSGASYYSPRWMGMLGYAPDELPGHYETFLTLLHPDDAPRVDAAIDAVLTDHLVGQGRAARAADGAPAPEYALEFRLRAKDGSWRWVLARGDVVERDADGTPVRMAGTHIDLTERKALEAALVQQATQDALTGLANRDHFRARLDAALAAAAEDAPDDAAATGVVVLFLDLDDFKAVNDSLGHASGDALLQAAAGRLLNATRGCDVVARLGGDEFAVLLEHVGGDAEAAVVAERVATVLSRPFAVAGREVRTPASVGIARARAGESADDLLRNADLAMYRAKGQGKGRVAEFAPAMHAAVVDRMALAADLRRVTDWMCEGAPDFGARDAVGEFVLVYQPIVAMPGDRITGAEALFRWRHPTRGFVSPAECIPLAEETGLIVPIGRWVLETACREAAGWGAPGRDAPGAFVSVNVSARQLQQPAFVDDVRTVLDATGLEAERLVLEITEGVLMQDTRAALERLHALKDLGVRLAVDDFGTGYSSLAYLQRFPLDVLKLDKAFVDPLARGGPHVALARTVLALGDALGLRCVAEGVETAEQRAQLVALGCGWGQGYLFARPLPAEAMRERLAEQAGALAAGREVVRARAA